MEGFQSTNPHESTQIASSVFSMDLCRYVKICGFAIFTLSSFSSFAAPRLAVPPEGVVFGEIAAGEGAAKSIEVRNVSELPVAVAQVKGCCGADASLSTMLIAPSESATLTVALRPPLPGGFSKDVRLLCDDPECPVVTIPVTGVAVEGKASAAAASRFTLPAILLAGIADGFNPCAFSLVIALAGILAVGGRQRRADVALVAAQRLPLQTRPRPRLRHPRHPRPSRRLTGISFREDRNQSLRFWYNGFSLKQRPLQPFRPPLITIRLSWIPSSTSPP